MKIFHKCYICRLIHGPAFRKREEMQFEGVRLASFVNWPESAAKTPTELSRNGFYYSGRDEVVKCFACAGEIDVYMLNENIGEEHQRLFPRCDFIRGEAKSIIGCGEDSCVSCPRGADGMDRAQNNEQKMSDLPAANGQVKSRVGCHLSSSSKTAESPPNDSRQMNKVRSEQPEKQTLPKQHRIVPKPTFPKYATEDSRMQSFIHWPKKSIINPTNLAKAGFFYLGYSDDVKCFYCGNGIRAWKSDCNPLMFHAQWYPNCDFMKQVMNDKKAEQNKACDDEMATSYNQYNIIQIDDADQDDTSNGSERHHMIGRTNPVAKSTQKEEMMKEGNLNSSTVKPFDDEELKKLKKEYKDLKRERTCKKCRNAFANIAFLPCGHILYCSGCFLSNELNCAHCNNAIKGVITVRFP